METGKKLGLADVFVSITDPRQPGKVEHDLVELLVVAVNAVLVGADTFVEIELWAKEKLDWLRGHLRLANGIPSHDTFGRLFGLIDPSEFEAAFRRWVEAILPALGADAVVAIDGKTSRRTGKVDATPLHLVSAFAAGARPAGDGGEVEREDGHPAVTREFGAGRLHRHHRRHGNTGQYRPSDT